MEQEEYQYSKELKNKIESLTIENPIKLGSIKFKNPMLLAPMSAICNAPFRLLMEELGAGGTVSELISCHGIGHGNERTRHMLTLDPREENVGIQIFGEDPKAMAYAAQVAEERGPKFIDINMGCPVRKVVSKGGGSALLKDPKVLGNFFSTIKKSLSIPLTIKIRTGWDEQSRNAHEVIRIAFNEGVEFVAIHGRTRTQQYKGNADWDYIESLVEDSPLPLIGNGDLHTALQTGSRIRQTKCQAVMLGRGPLRNPFIFLESNANNSNNVRFDGHDYFELVKRLTSLTAKYSLTERNLMVSMRKYILWFSAGFDGASHFRRDLFQKQELSEILKYTEDFFLGQRMQKKIDHSESFMTSGHG
ncbi:MAG: tRNA dihydrouridine synthase [Bacteriovoracaceae bacterium]